jgi:hypothetical protein
MKDRHQGKIKLKEFATVLIKKEDKQNYKADFEFQINVRRDPRRPKRTLTYQLYPEGIK